MVIWVRKKTGAPVVRINTVAEATACTKQYAIYAVGVFDEFELCQ